ncbi:unnamed protein product [Vicia faba]|uniref:Uncharacterized protein n=1 Tax=Vicia faba TaxID=3906 RepID=A0AAV1AJE7_VICFA|nr:unnamed protein product [Vicia faba]
MFQRDDFSSPVSGLIVVLFSVLNFDLNSVNRYGYTYVHKDWLKEEYILTRRSRSNGTSSVILALVLAMEVPSSKPPMLKLLKEAIGEALISSSQVVEGFSVLADDLDDLGAPE